MNIANKLTLLRIILVPVLLLFLAYDNVSACWASLIVFIIAAVTDLYDGILARQRQIITDWGKFIDPLADKILVAAVFICFVGIPTLHIPGWIVAVIVSREFVVTGLRLLAISKGIVIPASKEGKIKTAFQMTTIITILLIRLVRSHLETCLNLHLSSDMLLSILGCGEVLRLIIECAPYSLMLATAFLTTITGIQFIIKHRSVISIK